MKSDVNRPTYGYVCPTCHLGTIEATDIPVFRTVINKKLVTIIDACVGVCDRCNAKYFDPGEVRRWGLEGKFV